MVNEIQNTADPTTPTMSAETSDDQDPPPSQASEQENTTPITDADTTSTNMNQDNDNTMADVGTTPTNASQDGQRNAVPESPSSAPPQTSSNESTLKPASSSNSPNAMNTDTDSSSPTHQTPHSGLRSRDSGLDPGSTPDDGASRESQPSSDQAEK